MFLVTGSFVPRLRNVMAVLRPYQKIEDLFRIFTRIKATAERTTAETTP